MKLLFLDIDGVLNGHVYNPLAQSNIIDPKCVANLNYILMETGADIVLSSAWRYMIHGGEMTLLGFRYLLQSHGVVCVNLVGTTVKDEVCCHCGAAIECNAVCYRCEKQSFRSDQVTKFLRELPEPPEAYVVLDDMDFGFSAAGHPFIDPDPDKGLSEADAEKVVRLFDEQLKLKARKEPRIDIVDRSFPSDLELDSPCRRCGESDPSRGFYPCGDICPPEGCRNAIDRARVNSSAAASTSA